MQILPQLAAELPHALNYSGGCLRWDRWVRRPPLRLAGELHYGNTLAGLEGSLMRFLGPGVGGEAGSAPLRVQGCLGHARSAALIMVQELLELVGGA